MAATAYLFRWLGYYALTKARSSIRESKITKYMFCFPTAFIVLTFLSIIFVVLQSKFKGTLAILFGVYLIVIYTLVAILILIVVSLFLRKLKENNCKIFYEKKKSVWYYWFVIWVLLFSRAVSLIIDIIVQEKIETTSDDVKLFNDIVQLIFYYVELIPSIIIILALYKSYKEAILVRKSKEYYYSSGEKDTTLHFESRIASESDESKYVNWLKNNLSSSLIHQRRLENDGQTPPTGGGETDSVFENREKQFFDLSDTLAYY